MSNGLHTLIARIDEAVRLGDAAAITQRIKIELQEAIKTGGLTLPAQFRRIRPEGYARRLVHRNSEFGYTVVAMAWGPGQSTPLHDHAGIWCVEGVLEGQMDVTRFDLVEETSDGYRFEAKDRVRASVGTAGCLIPPFEYHILANALDTLSVTLHFYGGEMTMCHAFEPAGNGRYVRYERLLSYQD